MDQGALLEADLLRFYGVDLRGLVTGELSWRRLKSLVAGLPRQAAVVRAALDDGADWGVTDHLMASVVDLLSSANWQRGGGKGARPKPVTRPGGRTKGNRLGRPSPMTPDEVRAHLDSFKPNPEGADGD